MVHVTEAHDGRGLLTVENGRMTIHVSLSSKSVTNLYLGKAEDAVNDVENWIRFSVDEVEFEDGMKEKVHGFDIPVKNLDKEFDLALIGKKGTWYDHKVSVSDAVKIAD